MKLRFKMVVISILYMLLSSCGIAKTWSNYDINYNIGAGICIKGIPITLNDSSLLKHSPMRCNENNTTIGMELKLSITWVD